MSKKVKNRLKVKNEKVVVNTSMSIDYYKTLSKIKTAKGFTTEQDVIRFILKDFFNKNNF